MASTNQHGSLNSQEDQAEKQKQLACFWCDMALPTRDSLVRHLQSVHEDKKFPCHFCEEVFANKQFLNAHKMQVHMIGVGDHFICKFCEKNYNTISGLRSHVNISHTKTGKTCLLCAKTFMREVELTIHLELVHRKFFCHYCMGTCVPVFTNASGLKGHILREHKFNQSCTLCDAMFPDQFKLFEHLDEDHHKFPCYQCRSVLSVGDSIYDTSQQLKEHKESEHAYNGKSCHLCPRAFRLKEKLRSHLESRHGKFLCYFCDVVYATTVQLKIHREREHKNASVDSVNEEKRFPCLSCDSKFTSRGHLKRHVESAHGRFKSLHGLKRHVDNLHKNVNQTCVYVKKEHCNSNQNQAHNGDSEVNHVHIAPIENLHGPAQSETKEAESDPLALDNEPATSFISSVIKEEAIGVELPATSGTVIKTEPVEYASSMVSKRIHVTSGREDSGTAKTVKFDI